MAAVGEGQEEADDNFQESSPSSTHRSIPSSFLDMVLTYIFIRRGRLGRRGHHIQDLLLEGWHNNSGMSDLGRISNRQRIKVSRNLLMLVLRRGWIFRFQIVGVRIVN
jgi:hypothetical protein